MTTETEGGVNLAVLTGEQAERIAKGMIAMRLELNLDAPTEAEMFALLEWVDRVLLDHALVETVFDGTLTADWRPDGPVFRVTAAGKAQIDELAGGSDLASIKAFMRASGLDPDRLIPAKAETQGPVQ